MGGGKQALVMSYSQTSARPTLRWYQGLDRYCWLVLMIAALGWLFDTMDQNLFNLVRTPSLTSLLAKSYTDPKLLEAAVKGAGGLMTAIFLLGWAVGGFIFGILGDKLGRRTTMVLTILIYAIFTGLNGLAVDLWTYGATRFFTAVGVGGEWAAGAALVAEVFPDRSRPMALGLLQALSTVGNISAALITLVISSTLGGLQDHWRLVFFIGAAPALLVLWIRRSVKDPEQWVAAKEHAHTAAELGNFRELWTDPVLRRNTIAGVMMAAAGVGALWGIGFFSIDLLTLELRDYKTKAEIGQLTSTMFILQNVGSFFGIYGFAMFAERLGRRPAFFLWFALAWGAILLFFWGISGRGAGAASLAMILAPVLGFCTLGPFSGYSVYFPELYPTRLRATGCGFCYNSARVLAAGAPFLLGSLSQQVGYAMAATAVSFVYIFGFIGAAIGPETRGKALPQ